MNTSKTNGYGKLLVFFLVAVILIFAFGFVADGWESKKEPDSGNVADKNDEADENTDKAPSGNENNAPDDEDTYVPSYKNSLTGLNVSEELSRRRHTAFVMDTSSPLYGISNADMIVEFPVENGNTRLLVFTNDSTSIGKIGSLAPTKKYISNIAKIFNSPIVYYGEEGSRDYLSCDVSSSSLNLNTHKGYHYSEYGQFIYSNGNLIKTALATANIDVTGANVKLPFEFYPEDKNTAESGQAAKTVKLPFSYNSESELYYSQLDGMYTYAKNESLKSDLLNDKTVTFKNVFVLFSDAVTYEDKSGTEMILNTLGTGSGYYITDGVYKEILWFADENGNMSFTNTDGTVLSVNRGSSYIGYLKSSMIDKVSLY